MRFVGSPKTNADDHRKLCDNIASQSDAIEHVEDTEERVTEGELVTTHHGKVYTRMTPPPVVVLF